MTRIITGAELFGLGGVPRFDFDALERVYPVDYDARNEPFFDGYEPFMISMDRTPEFTK